ncbi:MAG TPA: energy transducer TonB, partial [Verrucomicrobiae bacterium]|nr:energy transducer TonB [Verrucomicrobiae bacterium]
YTLSSELARACLPQANRDEERKFAWTAAVCLLFLAVGIHGLFTRPVFTVPTPVPAEETIPVLFEPPPPPQPVDNAPTPESKEPYLDESVAPPPPPLVVAVANPAEAAFSVPVEGPVIIAPARLASAPPIDLQAASTSAPPITLFTGDTRGRYPPPTYPLEARERHLQGKLLLLVSVGADGLVSRAEIKETSGSELLDQHAAEWVKSRWVWPRGENRLFYVPVIFELK